MLDILTMSLNHARDLYDSWSNGVIFSLVMLVVLIISVVMTCVSIVNLSRLSEYHHPILVRKHSRLACVCGIVMFLFSIANMDYVMHFDNNYTVDNDQYQMRHIKKIYPSLPCHQTKPKHVCSNSVTHDIYKIHHIKHTKQLTKAVARRRYEHYHRSYICNKAHFGTPLGIHVHNKAKLYNLHWWNAI